MGWFKRQCLSWIIVFAAAICVSCQELTSTLREGNRTCPGEEVTFNCTVRDSSGDTIVLAWSSTEYIGQGALLQFTTANCPGANMTNGDVIATLTNNTVIDGGIRVLESSLHIVAVQASTVTCDVTNRDPVSIQFTISGVPGIPENVQAVETSESTENVCVLLVQWAPPTSSNGSDIDHYIVSIPSRDVTESSTQTTIHSLRVRDCRDNISVRVHIAAVNRLGCEGQPSADILASLLDNSPIPPNGPTTNGPTTPNRPTTNGPTPVEGGSTISTSGIAAIVAVIFILLCIMSITCLITAVFFWKQTRKGQYAYRELQEAKQDELKELYEALKSQSDEKIQVHARSLSRTLKKSSNESIKAALKTALERIQVESGKDVRTALDRMKCMITDLGSIDKEFETRINRLRTEAGNNQHKEVLKDLIKEVDGKEVQPDKIKACVNCSCTKAGKDQDAEVLKGSTKEVDRRKVQPDKIKDVLLKLCEELQKKSQDIGAIPSVIQGIGAIPSVIQSKGAEAWEPKYNKDIELVEHY